jgi:branched-chain amino acid transport system substrate-binding protein
VQRLFVGSGASKWDDPKNFPWTMGWIPNYQIEGRILAKYILKARPDAKIAVIFQNDDYGKDYLKGLKDGLGTKASLIVIEESYEVAEPAIDSHVVKAKSYHPDVLVSFACDAGGGSREQRRSTTTTVVTDQAANACPTRPRPV